MLCSVFIFRSLYLSPNRFALAILPDLIVFVSVELFFKCNVSTSHVSSLSVFFFRRFLFFSFLVLDLVCFTEPNEQCSKKFLHHSIKVCVCAWIVHGLQQTNLLLTLNLLHVYFRIFVLFNIIAMTVFHNNNKSNNNDINGSNSHHGKERTRESRVTVVH